jgi:hypothetical protein
LGRVNLETFTIILDAGLAHDGQLKKLRCEIPIYWRSFSNSHSHRAMKLQKVDPLAGWEHECSFWKSTADRPITNSTPGDGRQFTALG